MPPMDSARRLKGACGDEPESQPRLGSVLHVAEIYAGLQDKPRTLDALEKSYEERAWFLTCLNTAPEFDFIQSEPRFQTLLRRINFPH